MGVEMFVAVRVLQFRIGRAAQTRRLVFGDPDRCSVAMRDLGVEQAGRGKELDWRLPSFVTAAESLMGLLVGPGRRRANAAVEAIRSPTLLLWGDADQLVGEQVIQGLVARRSDWQQHTFDTVGHVPMMEVPDDFLEVVGGFLDRAPLAEPLAS